MSTQRRFLRSVATLVWTIAMISLAAEQAAAVPGAITTVAGNGTFGYSGDGGPATSAGLNSPFGVTVDGSGNLYIADGSNSRIRKVVLSTGVITTVAGNGTFGYSGDGGPATSAALNSPFGVAVDGSGNLYIADYANSRIRKVELSPIARQIALGLGPGTWGNIEIHNHALANYSHLNWQQVNWPWYDEAIGETRVAVGDLDGDGWDEIVVGLGSGSGGWIEVLHINAAHTGYQHMAWLQVPWSYYNNINGETRVAVGDLDGDGKAEIVVGLGKDGSGYLAIFGDATTGFAFKRWLRVPWGAYNSSDGETRPAVGDIDGNGKAEIVVGLGPQGNGYMAVIGDASTNYAFKSWFRGPVVGLQPAIGRLAP